MYLMKDSLRGWNGERNNRHYSEQDSKSYFKNQNEENIELLNKIKGSEIINEIKE